MFAVLPAAIKHCEARCVLVQRDVRQQSMDTAERASADRRRLITRDLRHAGTHRGKPRAQVALALGERPR